MTRNNEREKSIKVGKTIIEIIYSDITKLDPMPDVIVNSDDLELNMNSGVALAILNKAGPELQKEAHKKIEKRKVSLGDVIITNAGKLKNVKKVFHAITFDAKKGESVPPAGVRMATYYCLKKADELGLESIAFPAMGTGKGQLEYEAVSRAMIQQVFDYLNTSTDLKYIIFALYDFGAWSEFFEDFTIEAAQLKIKNSIPIRLSILRQDNINYIDLTTNETISIIKEQKISEKQLKIFSSVLEDFILGRKNKRFPNLTEFGKTIYNMTLSDVGERLGRLPSESLFLKLDDNLLNIPWELCNDGDEFFGLKYNIGRQVVVSPKFFIQSSTTRAINLPVRVLLVSDPTETLKGTIKECNQINDALMKIDGIEVTYQKGKEIDVEEFKIDLASYDLVHYAGHAFYDEEKPSESGWVFSFADEEKGIPDETLTAREMSGLNAPPIVFSNACESGTQSSGTEKKYQSEIFGIASGFLMGGIHNYIGTFTYVSDDPSVDLAVNFYENLISEKKSIGKSLRTARKFIIDKYGIDEILWASYMLYG
ncbi:MAG: CHAT domain-containing protein, partial [Candidatus Lokiarchaeota archaeon]|nr:CHAT domain-containing protein [Candidatus Lokiarchaeota archaeon]